MKKPPTMYGVVSNLNHYDEREVENRREDQSYVEFVVRGEIEWVDKTKNNVIKNAVDIDQLTLVENKLSDLKAPRKIVKRDFLKSFEKCMID